MTMLVQLENRDSQDNRNPLLTKALIAHGGWERWKDFTTLSATIVTRGALWGLKGVEQDADPRRITVDLEREWSSLDNFGRPEWHTIFTPQNVAIVDRDGQTIAERFDPRLSFADHDMTTAWDPLHRAYFNGYALWTYLTTPFVLAEPGFKIIDIDPLHGNETWEGLRAIFPDRIATHSREQDFYFGPDGLLRRHDYHVDVAGGFAAVHLVSDFVEVQGLRFPTSRRAYQRGTDLRPRMDPLMVSIDVSDFDLR